MDKTYRLKRRKDFTQTYKRGKSVASKSVVLCYRKNGRSEMRVGFTVSKKVGNAVVRNKVRRRMKEIVRLHQEMFAPGCDYVFVARVAAAKYPYISLEREMLSLLKKVIK